MISVKKAKILNAKLIFPINRGKGNILNNNNNNNNNVIKSLESQFQRELKLMLKIVKWPSIFICTSTK